MVATLAEIRKSPNVGRTFTVSDFASEGEMEQLKNARKTAQKPLYDVAEAVSAEILARFGFDAWRAWQEGRIEYEYMLRLLSAERVRENQRMADLEAFMFVLATSSYKQYKGERKPKGFDVARDLLREKMKGAR